MYRTFRGDGAAVGLRLPEPEAALGRLWAMARWLLLDLSTGMAEFVKLAACPALVAWDGAVERIEGGRLPLGILDRVHPAATRMQLMPGDVVFMASDGVMDAADPDALEALLLDAAAARPCEGEMNALAQRALRLAGDGLSRDDMTVICVRVARQ